MDGMLQVTLVIPWLAKPDQAMVFPHGQTFQSPEEQEDFVRKWVKHRTGLDCPFAIKFYPSRYAEEKCSILPVGDPTAYISDSEVQFYLPIKVSVSLHLLFTQYTEISTHTPVR